MPSARRPTARGSSPSAACATSAPRSASPISARRSRSARRAATASSSAPTEPCLYPIMTTIERRDDDAGRRRCRSGLHRQLRCAVARHQLRGAARGRHRRPDAVGQAVADAGAGAHACCRRTARAVPDHRRRAPAPPHVHGADRRRPAASATAPPSTCGAGMLDARAAVIAAVGVQAQISVTTAAPTAGQPVTIALHLGDRRRPSATYLWAIVDGGTTGADDHRREQRRHRDRRADRRRHVHDQPDHHRQQRLRLDRQHRRHGRGGRRRRRARTTAAAAAARSASAG